MNIIDVEHHHIISIRLNLPGGCHSARETPGSIPGRLTMRELPATSGSLKLLSSG